MHILVVSADGASASGGPTQCFVPPLPPPATLAPFPALAPRSRRLPPLADPPIMRAVLLLLAALAVGAQGRQMLGSAGIAVLNGLSAEKGRYDYVASLRYPFYGDAKDPTNPVLFSQQACVGVLFQPDMVLTTAWCAVNAGLWPRVRLGSYQTYGGAAETRHVIATVWHAGYKGRGDDAQDDIAVMQLDSKAVKIRPVAIPGGTPDPPVKVGTVMTILGWGLTAYNATKPPANLMKATQQLLTQPRCSHIWGRGSYPIQAAGWGTNKMLCTQCKPSNTALCFGDGGAPLILEGKAKAGCQPGKKGGSTSGCAPPDLVVGLGSQSDCRGRGPRASGSVFTSLSHYSGWIKGAVGRLRREAGSYGAYKVARKAAYPPKRGCKNVGHRCREDQPGSCCSGKCWIWTCLP
ncbi:granzyme M isoform X1 [Micractinium conductrix]|uniref:Granzyme M isoform X1 n=1 Tax=Micractinium conductrix TaxID=554055 RepID=A0A2P6V5C0_9CHLO|nr:granzyme M isoform X1 [Micractinium conductrix]|eukprot:PSC69286.1 granzyme M isoform X1 [Micractinium conductrix]